MFRDIVSYPAHSIRIYLPRSSTTFVLEKKIDELSSKTFFTISEYIRWNVIHALEDDWLGY